MLDIPITSPYMEILEWPNIEKLSLIYQDKPEGLNLWVAGGCFTSFFYGEEPKDIDIFSDDPEAVSLFLASKFPCTKNTHWIAEFKSEIGVLQVIKTYKFKDTTDLLDNFDFTHVSMSYDGKTHLGLPNSPHCIRTKYLVIRSFFKPVHTLQRVLKNIGRGFTIEPPSLKELILQINRLPEESLDSSVFYQSENPLNEGSEVLPYSKKLPSPGSPILLQAFLVVPY